MNPYTGPDPVLVGLLARYCAGEVSLETAATEWARIYMESTRRLQFELRRSLTSRNGDAASSEGEGGVTRNITEPDLPKVRALFERVEAKLDLMRSELIEESAREYLSSAGNSPFDKAVRLLANDVTETLGDRHLPVVWSFAAHVRQLELEDPSTRCIEDVQQHFQDTFVDTTWPACPRHPNHPLDYAEGFWRCPRDGAVVACLGELSRHPGNRI